MKEIESGKVPCEIEESTISTEYNDYILTTLRTKWGCDINYISRKFGNFFTTYFITSIDKEIKNGNVKKQKNIYTLTNKGKLFADKVASDLFVIKPEINEFNYSN